MILLFGGTSETAELATSLAHIGYSILVSTATDAPLDIGDHTAIRRRCGRLDVAGMLKLIAQESVRIIVDSSHPYAIQLHETVAKTAQQAGIPCFRYQRKPSATESDNLFFVANHEEAAALAVSFGVTLLLTTGSRNLSPYIKATQARNIPLFARILPHAESRRTCDQAGLPVENQIVGRGPFSEAENRKLIRSKRIGVLITKDSGIRGGVEEKISAARHENCQVIVVRRPRKKYGYGDTYEDIFTLVDALKAIRDIKTQAFDPLLHPINNKKLS